MHSTHAHRLPLGTSKNSGNSCVSCTSPKRADLTNRPKPFKNLVKMNNSTVWSPPAATQRRSGSRHARSERELRAKCVTWESLKNHRETLLFQCAPWVRQFSHDDVLCSKGQHVCMCGMCDSASELIPKLIKSRVMCVGCGQQNTGPPGRMRRKCT